MVSITSNIQALRVSEDEIITMFCLSMEFKGKVFACNVPIDENSLNDSESVFFIIKGCICTIFDLIEKEEKVFNENRGIINEQRY